MLVLSRNKNEEIMIGDEVSIMVVDIRGDKVRIGITAPNGVAVHRREVFEAIKRQGQNNGTEATVNVTEIIATVKGEGETAQPETV